MANIDITDQGGGSLSNGILQLENGVAMDTTLRYVADQLNTKSQLLLATNGTRVDGSLAIGAVTSPSGLLHVDGGASVPRIILDADTNVARIFSFRTNDSQRWAFRIDGNETGTNAGSNFAIRRYNDGGTFVAAPISVNRATGLTTISEGLNLGGSELQNFSANLETLAANTTFDGSNTATYNGSVTKVSGARTFTFDNALPLGFTMTVIQTDANQTTFAGAGAAVISNRQSHTKNNGQYSVVSIVKIDNNSFILGGDTAA